MPHALGLSVFLSFCHLSLFLSFYHFVFQFFHLSVTIPDLKVNVGRGGKHFENLKNSEKFNILAFLKKKTLFIDQKCTSKKRAKKFGHG